MSKVNVREFREDTYLIEIFDSKFGDRRLEATVGELRKIILYSQVIIKDKQYA